MTNPTAVVRAGEAPRFALPGVEFTSRATPSLGSAEICAWTIAVSPGLDSPEPHTLDRAEIFLVASGTLRLHPDAELLHAGDTAVVPAGTPIQLANPGDTVARAHVAVPVGFVARTADGSEIGTPPWAR